MKSFLLYVFGVKNELVELATSYKRCIFAQFESARKFCKWIYNEIPEMFIKFEESCVLCLS